MESLITLCYAAIIISITVAFFYFISLDKNPWTYIAKLILSEIILFFLFPVISMLLENYIIDSIIKYYFSGDIFPQWFLILLPFFLVLRFAFVTFCGAIAFLYLATMALPKITYSAKIAPLMTLLSGLVYYMLDKNYLPYDNALNVESYSIIITAIYITVLSCVVFADKDYVVKQNNIKLKYSSDDIFDRFHKISEIENRPHTEEEKAMYEEELYRLHTAKKLALEELDKSYRRNLFVRFNRNL